MDFKEKEKHFVYAIALTDEAINQEQIVFLRSEHSLTKEGAERFEVGRLFKIENNIRFRQFDGDEVLIDLGGEVYHQTGNSYVSNQFPNDKIVALIDEYGEAEWI